MKITSAPFFTTIIALSSLLLLSNFCSALRFGIIGDWGMGGRSTPWDPEIRSAAAISEACETFFAEGFCNFTISCGDNIYTPDVAAGLRNSFKLFSDKIGPVFPVSGNHDNMGPQLAYSKVNKRWKWPSRFYDFKVPIDDQGRDGHTVHFFGLDVMAGGLQPGGAQYKWLEEKLSNCNSRWKIMFGHFPVAGSGRHRREGAVTALTTIMQKYNVQAYFSGHDHILDVNMNVGKVLPVSGAMSRGGMMLRGLAGGLHQFTLTQPGEYNANKEDWPGHGFFTAELSPNILTVHAWDHYGSIMYTFQVTHDWVSKVHTESKSMEYKFPPPEEVRKAALDETKLPRGPGGGTFYTLAGDEIEAPKYFTDGSSGVGTAAPNQETKPRLTEKPLDTTFTKFKDEHPVTTATKIDHFQFTTTVAPEDKKNTQEREILAKYVRYTVSSECWNCGNDVYSQEPFSIFVIGTDLPSKARMFISKSKIGCAFAKNFPKFVEGTSIVQPAGNQAIFNATRSVASTYVCLSLDAGRNFYLLKRADDEEFVDEFAIGAARSWSMRTPSSGNNNNNQQQQGTPSPQPASNTNPEGDNTTNDVDTSTGALVSLAGIAILAGVGIAYLTRSEFVERMLSHDVNDNDDDEQQDESGQGRRTSSRVSRLPTSDNTDAARAD